METEEITVKTEKKQNIVLKKFCMFCVALLSCLIATASSSWMSAKGVVAVGGVPVLLNEVTQADIDDAKERRDAARAEADEASEMISQLEDQRTDLEGEQRACRKDVPLLCSPAWLQREGCQRGV